MQTLEERGRGKGKRILSRVRAPDKFITLKEVANFEEWTRNRRKIAPGHRVDFSDMQGMEVIRNLFNMIGWVPLLTVNELPYPEIIYEFYANLHKGRIERVENIPHQWVLSRIGGRDFTFDDRAIRTRCQNESDKDDEEDDNDTEQEERNVDEEESDLEPEEETHRREISRKKKEKKEWGTFHLRNIRSIFGVSRLNYIEAKDLGDQGIMKKKRSSHSKIKT
ncbi:hypothetical protein M9H77_29641 [Catharanthus roseus]|uniref:Uncharacterized protein n=1 Tax=Catharanthus roseus TaxID=4058 RepID=A0ACB9ZWY5_CATRO|nr:hypothetical protein M9H77_29641 [Catharanthus roseus]